MAGQTSVRFPPIGFVNKKSGWEKKRLDMFGPFKTFLACVDPKRHLIFCFSPEIHFMFSQQNSAGQNDTCWVLGATISSFFAQPKLWGLYSEGCWLHLWFKTPWLGCISKTPTKAEIASFSERINSIPDRKIETKTVLSNTKPDSRVNVKVYPEAAS